MSINHRDVPDLKVMSPQVDAKQRIDQLKAKTKMTLKLVDTIQRLKIGYYFQEDTSEILEKLKQSLPDDDDIHIAALCF
ncbi:probable terpene synthase 11 [Tanacetum coccineum]